MNFYLGICFSPGFRWSSRWPRIGCIIGWVFVVAVLALAGLGIYIGRFLRWNSWDVLQAPVALLTNVASRLYEPVTHPGAYGFSLLCFFFLLSTYLVLYTLTGLRAAPQSVAEIRR